MNPPISPVPRRRRIWPWVVLAIMTPLVVLAGAAYNYLTLDRDAAALRGQVMTATDGGWKTKVQFSAGRPTLGAIRAGLLLFKNVREKPEVRLGLKTVRSISVGVYERRETGRQFQRDVAMLLNQTDALMSGRGWERIIAVNDEHDTVMVYLPSADTEPNEVCLAVLTGRELVVVSAVVSPEALADLIELQAGDKLDWKRLAKF